MPSPLRRGTKIYFRKAVPKELRAIVGKSEIFVSLRTSDVEAARPEFARLNSLWEQRFQLLRRGVTKLSNKEAYALAGEFYKRMVDDNEDDPDPRSMRRAAASVDAHLAGQPGVRLVSGGDRAFTESVLARYVQERRSEIDAFLVEQGIVLSKEYIPTFVKAVSKLAFEGQKRLIANSEGDYGPDHVRDRLPVWTPPEDRFASPGEAVSKKYDVLEIFDQMSRERNHSPATRERWRPIIETVAKVHPAIRTLTGDWCVEYKDRLVASGLSTKTIKV